MALGGGGGRENVKGERIREVERESAASGDEDATIREEGGRCRDIEKEGEMERQKVRERENQGA